MQNFRCILARDGNPFKIGSLYPGISGEYVVDKLDRLWLLSNTLEVENKDGNMIARFEEEE